MKNLSKLSILALLLLLGACSTPADYYQSIMNEIVKVDKINTNIQKLLRENKIDEAQTAFLNGQKQTKASLKKLESISAFREDDSLWKAAIGFVAFYDELFADDEPFTDEAFFIKEVEVKDNFLKEQLIFIKKCNLIASRE